MKTAGPIVRMCDTLAGLLYPRRCVLTGQRLEGEGHGWLSSGALEGLVEIQAPYCERCGTMYDGDISAAFVCINCEGLEFSFEKARAHALARGPVRELIHRFKYHQELWLREELARWAFLAWNRFFGGESVDALVPVPIHPRKWRERGFNQAAEISRGLTAHCGVPTRDVLRRTRDTESQTHFSRAQRLGNLRRALELRTGRDWVENKVLVLVDDVFTTGATAHECARVLREAGAQKVFVLTVARG